MATSQPIRVVVGDDSYLIRAGIAHALADVAEIAIAGLAADLASLREMVADVAPDVVIADIRMPPTGTDEGVAFAVELAETRPEIAVIVLSQYTQLAFARRLFAPGNPRRAYLLKDRVSDPTFLIESVKSVVAGIAQLDPRVVSMILRPDHAPDQQLQLLTDREREVLELVASGATNASVAKQLYLSARAVERHINAIFEKLELPDGADSNRRVLAALAYAAAQT